jgi:hypothetical protein
MGARGQVLTSMVVVCGVVSLAGAQPAKAPAKVPAKAPASRPVPAAKTPQLTAVNANQIMKLTAETGFVDDVLSYDNQRLAYVIADTSTKAELHVVQLGCVKCVEQKQELVVDLSPVTLRPTALRLVGQRAFVIGATEDGNQVAALVELGQKTATAVYKLGPAAHISVVMRDGAPRVAVHKTTATKTGTRHDVELVALDTGKRVIAAKPFELEKDANKKLDFRVNHWTDGYTRAVGLKGGEWIKKDNVRSPDSEATYDLIGGKMVETKPIADVVEQRKRYQTLADAGQLDFIRMTWDNAAVQIWHHGVARAIELDQPLSSYDVTSLQGVVNADGSAWVALKIDPVNAAAVARKKADPEYLDVFKVDAAGKGVRKARVPAKNLRFRFGTFDAYFWLLERSTGFDRGGRSITVYQAL